MFSHFPLFCNQNENSLPEYSRRMLRVVGGDVRVAVFPGKARSGHHDGKRNYRSFAESMLTLDGFPRSRKRRKLLFNDGCTFVGIKLGRAAKHVNINSVVLGICVGTEMTLGQHKYTRRTHRFKLVKSPGHHGKPAPFSDSLHYMFKVIRLGDPYCINVTHQMLHLCFKGC
jgi:hypothetical protein